MKKLEKVLNVQRMKNKVSKSFVVCVIFFATMLGNGIRLVAQEERQIVGGGHQVNYSNPVFTTDCCPELKNIVDSIMNNATFVFEGRMIKEILYADDHYRYDSYLFEIEKVYRGGERLQAGTVELIVDKAKTPLTASHVRFYSSWYIIFAKETDDPSFVEANNPIKLELFYNDKYDRYSCFVERRGGYTSDLGINFQTKGEVQNFLSTYNLRPTDIPQADTLKTLSKREIEKAKVREIQAKESAEEERRK